MADFTTNLKQLRKSKGESQRQIAEDIGIKQTTYSDYERGRSEPTLNILMKLASHFTLSIDHLVGFTLDLALNNEEKALKDKILDKAGMGNTEFVGNALLLAPTAVANKITNKKPTANQIKNKEIRKAVEEIKEENSTKQNPL